MVVILIFSILLLLGNYGNITQRREKARIEELAVEIITLIDQQKVDTLLGKTESSEIVRKRKIVVDFISPNLTYNSYADLVEDMEWTYCGVAPGCTDIITPWWPWTDTPLTTKSWAPLGLGVSLWDCDSGTPVSTTTLPLTIELQWDTMSFLGANTTIKHIVIQLSRQGSYREIHIDRRTGVTYEREGVMDVSCI